ncbi:hypothetical protein PTTG_28472 [Puccinia triticina 1-1 BBBD Race 1]|uniref:Uncharacterized protein n=1 Tax=Puccinia triticina (isolate 1-1 / race 1 (BBBD)) TaxID=630390 RepID=A0A180GBA2_PUCT1|nr:hypothetical protein PTTG_28472 [Puccinia triticina 1-1 BBBD Race 1]
MNGRWANKPKFHHLLHLPESIRRYGPASLFATEKFESFNGVIRNASIHSNRLSPSRDIATSFNNYNIIRLLLSGAILFDHEHQRYFQASPEIRALFENNQFIQKAMGYNSHWFGCGQLKPTIHGHRGERKAGELVPAPLLRNFPTLLITRVNAVRVDEKEIIRDGTFVLVQERECPHGIIFCFESIWEVGNNQFYAKIQRCIKTGTQPENNMTILVKQLEFQYVPAQRIICTINVQHNCFAAQCHVRHKFVPLTGRQEGGSHINYIDHTPMNSYPLNAVSHHAPYLHRKHSNMYVQPIPEEMMKLALEEGLHMWQNEGK